jgi:hypothetical protein
MAVKENDAPMAINGTIVAVEQTPELGQQEHIAALCPYQSQLANIRRHPCRPESARQSVAACIAAAKQSMRPSASAGKSGRYAISTTSAVSSAF